MGGQGGKGSRVRGQRGSAPPPLCFTHKHAPSPVFVSGKLAFLVYSVGRMESLEPSLVLSHFFPLFFFLVCQSQMNLIPYRPSKGRFGSSPTANSIQPFRIFFSLISFFDRFGLKKNLISVLIPKGELGIGLIAIPPIPFFPPTAGFFFCCQSPLSPPPRRSLKGPSPIPCPTQCLQHTFEQRSFGFGRGDKQVKVLQRDMCTPS